MSDYSIPLLPTQYPYCRNKIKSKRTKLLLNNATLSWHEIIIVQNTSRKVFLNRKRKNIIG